MAQASFQTLSKPNSIATPKSLPKSTSLFRRVRLLAVACNKKTAIAQSSTVASWGFINTIFIPGKLRAQSSSARRTRPPQAKSLTRPSLTSLKPVASKNAKHSSIQSTTSFVPPILHPWTSFAVRGTKSFLASSKIIARSSQKIATLSSASLSKLLAFILTLKKKFSAGKNQPRKSPKPNATQSSAYVKLAKDQIQLPYDRLFCAHYLLN